MSAVGELRPDRLFDLRDKIALVTGASRGLGRMITLGLAAAGADVVIVSRKAEACQQVADEVRDIGRLAFVRACHVGHWDELDSLVGDAYAHFGRVDVLVNNAGKSPLYASLEAIDESYLDAVLNLNFKGPFRLSALVGRRMADGDGGSIVNVSSAGALRPSPRAVPYAASKAALNTMTVAMAMVYAPKVRVNALLPGPFRTDVARSRDSAEFAERARVGIALGRAGEPAEIVGAALYLASGASSFTTGTLISVDGGTRQ
jgi:NAD(P)-dependent dehydrogenase (short-subunit alcohol dehydrogenase family)